MKKKILSENSLYYGEIETPKGYEIDRDQIRNDIIDSFVNKNRINNNPKTYAFEDYVVPFSQPLQWMQDYIRDHFFTEHHKKLVFKRTFGNVMKPNEKSWTRHLVDPVDLRNSPDFTLIYGVDVKEDSTECIIEYDDNRRKYRSNHIPIKNNEYIIFPSTNRYSFSPNTSKGLNVILTITYEYI